MEDLGTAIESLSVLDSQLDGDVLYLRSRNLEPERYWGLDLRTGQMTVEARLPYATAPNAPVDPTGRYYYTRLRNYGRTDPNSTLFRLDLDDPSAPVQVVARVEASNAVSLATAPDGAIAIAGTRAGSGLVQLFDPTTNTLTSATGVPAASTIFGVTATEDHLYAGGSVTATSTTPERGFLLRVDRATMVATDITPPQMAGHARFAEVGFVDGYVIGTSNGSSDNLYVIDPQTQQVRTTTSTRTAARRFAAYGDQILFRAGNSFRTIDPDTMALSDLSFPGMPTPGDIFGLFVWDGKIVSVPIKNHVLIADPATGTWRTIRHADSGIVGDAQKVMGIAADDQYAYAGGNGETARHDVLTGEVTNFPASTEMKAAEIVDGLLYMSMYAPGSFSRYDPTTGTTTRLAPFPTGYIRGTAAAADRVRGWAVVGGRSDATQSGVLGIHKIAEGTTSIFPEVLGPGVPVQGVAAHDGLVIASGPSVVASIDPDTGERLWELDGVGGAVAILDGLLYTSRIGGGFAVVDLATREVVHRADLRALQRNAARFRVWDGQMYAVSHDTFFHIDPVTYAATPLVENLIGDWYSGVSLDVDSQGRFYTLRDRNLIRITLVEPSPSPSPTDPSASPSPTSPSPDPTSPSPTTPTPTSPAPTSPAPTTAPPTASSPSGPATTASPSPGSSSPSGTAPSGRAPSTSPTATGRPTASSGRPSGTGSGGAGLESGSGQAGSGPGAGDGAGGLAETGGPALSVGVGAVAVTALGAFLVRRSGGGR